MNYEYFGDLRGGGKTEEISLSSFSSNRIKGKMYANGIGGNRETSWASNLKAYEFENPGA